MFPVLKPIRGFRLLPGKSWDGFATPAQHALRFARIGILFLASPITDMIGWKCSVPWHVRLPDCPARPRRSFGSNRPLHVASWRPSAGDGAAWSRPPTWCVMIRKRWRHAHAAMAKTKKTALDSLMWRLALTSPILTRKKKQSNAT
jgi:hypothetical protein